MTTNHPLLPAGLNAIAENTSQGFGVGRDTTALLVAQAVAFAAGNTVTVQTPDGRPLGPGFNLALVSNGTGFVRGSLMALNSPVMEIIEKACEQGRERGTQATKNAFEAILTTRHEIRNRIARNEADLHAVRTKNARADEFAERMSEGTEIAPGEFDEIRKAGFDFEKQAELESTIGRDRETVKLVEADLQTLRLAAAPGILADEPHWKSVPNLPDASFDQSAVALNFSGVSQLSLMTRKELAGISRSFVSSHIGKSGVNMVACASADTYCQLLANPSVRDSAIFSTFAFTETTESGDCDPSAIEAACNNGTWRQLLKNLFLARMSRSQKVLLLDHDGFQAYAAFRAWCRQEVPAALRPYFGCWPDLCLRLALIRSIIAKADEIPAEDIQRAAEYLKSRPATLRLVEGLVEDETPEQQRESRIERICRKLSDGPLTRRGIARRMHRQDYSAVEKMIAEAMRAGRVERRGDFFFAVDVCVSAAAA